MFVLQAVDVFRWEKGTKILAGLSFDQYLLISFSDERVCGCHQ